MKNDPMTVLVVDDEVVNVLILREVLSQEGFEVFTAESGPEARRIAREVLPDIVLLDVLMPDENGFDTCRKLKSDPLTTDIPIIFISGVVDTESKVTGLSVGGWDYISKPFHSAEVLARVRNCLKVRMTYQGIIAEQAKRLHQVRNAQQTILVKPEELPAARFSVAYLPMMEAGGDFYDVFEIAGGVYGYFVADITGHDLEASFATSALKAVVRQNATPLFTPQETMRILNSVLTTVFANGQHLTATYVHLNRRLSRLTVVNAAHLPVVIISRTGDIQLVKADGDIVGAFEKGIFKSRRIETKNAERFFLYTDGLLDSASPGGDRQQGLEMLLSVCRRCRSMPLDAAVVQIVDTMVPPSVKRVDDVLLLGVDL